MRLEKAMDIRRAKYEAGVTWGEVDAPRRPTCCHAWETRQRDASDDMGQERRGIAVDAEWESAVERMRLHCGAVGTQHSRCSVTRAGCWAFLLFLFFIMLLKWARLGAEVYRQVPI